MVKDQVRAELFKLCLKKFHVRPAREPDEGKMVWKSSDDFKSLTANGSSGP
jgi:hypothetical protein